MSVLDLPMILRQYIQGPKKGQPKIKVNKKTGCWEWVASLRHDGYGQVAHPDRPGMRAAHRAVYEALVEKLDPKLHIHHICGVPHCVNPEHLREVTALEHSVIDPTFGNGNKHKTHCGKCGEPYSGNNLRTSKEGKRACKNCQRRHKRDKYASDPAYREKLRKRDKQYAETKKANLRQRYASDPEYREMILTRQKQNRLKRKAKANG